jgi:hypothetical protein
MQCLALQLKHFALDDFSVIRWRRRAIWMRRRPPSTEAETQALILAARTRESRTRLFRRPWLGFQARTISHPDVALVRAIRRPRQLPSGGGGGVRVWPLREGPFETVKNGRTAEQQQPMVAGPNQKPEKLTRSDAA